MKRFPLVSNMRAIGYWMRLLVIVADGTVCPGGKTVMFGGDVPRLNTYTLPSASTAMSTATFSPAERIRLGEVASAG